MDAFRSRAGAARPRHGRRRFGWNRGVARTVSLAVLVTVGISVGSAPVRADETPATAGATTSPDTPTGDAAAAPPRAIADPTLLEALAAARSANADLGGVDVRIIGDDDFRKINDAISTVINYLKNKPYPPELDIDPNKIIDTEQILAMVDDLNHRLQALRLMIDATAEVVAGEVAKVRLQAEAVVDALSVWASAQIAGAIDALPTAEEVQALARSIDAYVRGQADDASAALLNELARVSAYLTDDQHQRTAKTAVTTLLLTLANTVNPLPAWLAPTAEVAVNASGELVSWADDLVQQGVEGPGPFYGKTDTDTDEAPASSTDGVTPLNSDLVVADQAIAVEQPTAVTKPVPPTTAIGLPAEDTVAANAPYDCGMYPARNESCVPPMRSGGGRVIQRPIVRVVLVGSWWYGETNLRGGLENVFGNMSGSGYQNILRQYYDLTAGYVGPEVIFQGTHILAGSPPPIASSAQVASYAVRASRERAGWKTSPSVVWVVALPPQSVADSATYGPYGKCGYQAHATSATSSTSSPRSITRVAARATASSCGVTRAAASRLSRFTSTSAQ